MMPDLLDKLADIKSLGYKIKLDTNGYRPDVLATLHREGLLDYVAMDIKSGPEGYAKAAGLPVLDLDRIRESVSYLRGCGLPYEFRTTVVKELHSREDMLSIGRWLAGPQPYFLQSYQESAGVISPVFEAFSKEELEELYKSLLFHETAGELDQIRERFAGYSVERFLFYLKDRLDAASLKAVLQALKER